MRVGELGQRWVSSLPVFAFPTALDRMASQVGSQRGCLQPGRDFTFSSGMVWAEGCFIKRLFQEPLRVPCSCRLLPIRLITYQVLQFFTLRLQWHWRPTRRAAVGKRGSGLLSDPQCGAVWRWCPNLPPRSAPVSLLACSLPLRRSEGGFSHFWAGPSVFQRFALTHVGLPG